MLAATVFYSKATNWELVQMEIYKQESNKKTIDFLINDSQFFYAWLVKDQTEYLITAEDIYGGQTVVDLNNNHVAGYSPNEDGYIWTDFHLSPDGKILVTIGCVWACPFTIKVFDFSDPMKLPLPELNEIELIGNDEVITGWQDNEIFITEGVERVYLKDLNGTTTNILLSEKPIKRLVNINGGFSYL